MFRLSPRAVATLVPMVAVMSCGRRSVPTPPLFRLLPPAQTGITFANTIVTNDSLNEQTDPYVYNGGGVAIAVNGVPFARLSGTNNGITVRHADGSALSSDETQAASDLLTLPAQLQSAVQSLFNPARHLMGG